VKKSGLFMTVLLSLFIFQSLWNVAAAFCGHEIGSKSSTNTNIRHFGHHLTTACHSEMNIHDKSKGTILSKAELSLSKTENAVKAFSNLTVDDHRDHLPSFAYFMVLHVQNNAQDPKFRPYLLHSFSDWNNTYQSPHLYGLNPPPVFAPL